MQELCVSESRIYVFGLCQTKGEDASSALSPKDRRCSRGQHLQPRHGKKMPEHIACSDGILALDMHTVAKEISNKLCKPLWQPLGGHGHHI